MKNTGGKIKMNFSDLHPEQIDAINWILNKRVGCIAPECGSGKTVIGLTAFKGASVIYERFSMKMLVVSTPMGIKETWSKEHFKWEHLKNLHVVVLDGNQRVRIQKFENNYETSDVICISYNNLQWLTAYQEINKNSHYFFVYADEGSCLKGHDSKWRKALESLSQKAIYKIISTATPAPHDATDYWGLCKYLDGGKCLNSPNITRFREQYCHAIPIPNRVGHRYELRKGATDEIKRRVHHLFYTFEMDKGKEPEIETIDWWADLSPHAQKIYDEVVKRQAISEDGEPMDAMALSNKLAQIANGFVYMDEDLRISEEELEGMGGKEVLSLIRGKGKKANVLFNDRLISFLKLVGEIYQKHEFDTPIAIPYLFKQDLVMLKSMFAIGVSDEEPNVAERWNRGKIKYLFLQYGRSSKSLNLQEGGYIMASYSPTWNWEHDYQIVRRLARQGQPADKVYYYRLLMRNTVDEDKRKVLEQRGENHVSFQKLVADSVRKRIIE